MSLLEEFTEFRNTAYVEWKKQMEGKSIGKVGFDLWFGQLLHYGGKLKC